MLNVGKEIAVLKHMTVAELRGRYAEVFGEETRSHHKDFLVKRIAWRLQMQAEGDLSERARARAAELANDADIRMTPPRRAARPDGASVAVGTLRISADRRLPMAGTVLTREYKGRTVIVTILPNGFEYEGKVYRSLSAVAKAVTGTHWNGYHFFNRALCKPRGHSALQRDRPRGELIDDRRPREPPPP